jgi:hypothetical protein
MFNEKQSKVMFTILDHMCLLDSRHHYSVLLVRWHLPCANQPLPRSLWRLCSLPPCGCKPAGTWTCPSSLCAAGCKLLYILSFINRMASFLDNQKVFTFHALYKKKENIFDQNKSNGLCKHFTTQFPNLSRFKERQNLLKSMTEQWIILLISRFHGG